MIDITQYLQDVYEDLQKYVDDDVCLCKFKELKFEAGELPDYEDINIQQLYLLRYAFAYAFEYSRMYSDVLSQMNDANSITITSVGCGSMIDYWSLVHALEMQYRTNCNIKYFGIDKINWKYKISPRQNDEVKYFVENAVDFFTNNNQFIYDVYFFPKSISEFSDGELNTMANSFSSKNTQNDKFFVCISLREDQGSMDRDIQKTKCIIKTIGRNGFKTKWPYSQYTYFDADNGIAKLDYNFQYPSDALKFVKDFYTKCRNYKIQEKNCQSDCQKYLSRSPVLKVNHIRYQVIMFERVN